MASAKARGFAGATRKGETAQGGNQSSHPPSRTIETGDELLDAYKNEPVPEADPAAFKRLLHQRGRRSGGRKG
jgi:hypothetical protein